MKRGVFAIIILFSLILSITFVSAFSFNNLMDSISKFFNQITGKTVSVSCLNGGWWDGYHCWYEASSPSQGCNEVCVNNNGVEGGSCLWQNVPKDCSIVKHFHPGCTCWNIEASNSPSYRAKDNYCFFPSSTSSDCGPNPYNGQGGYYYTRICACNGQEQLCIKDSADLNKDGVVNDADLAILNASWGKKCTSPTWCGCSDINQDGEVNVGDLGLLGKQYNTTINTPLSTNACTQAGYTCAVSGGSREDSCALLTPVGSWEWAGDTIKDLACNSNELIGCCKSKTTTTITPICDDGNINSGEECDDGNKINGDGCSSECINEIFFTPEWICMDSFNKAYRESDGNLKDKTFCPAGCENAECNLESYCNELIVGHNNIEENRINIIFIGFNFNTINEVKDITNTYVNQLTSHEPFNSNKDKFNYWYINQLPKVDNPLTSYISGLAGGFEMGLKSNELSSLCLFQNKQVVNIGNWLFTSNFGGRSMRISAYDTRDIVFSHEFGHSFGGLEDEYLAFNSFAYYDSPGTMNCDSYNPETGVACPKWCKGIAKPIEEFEKVDCSSITDPISCSNINPCMYINTFGKTGCVNAITMCKEITDKSACELNKLCEWKDNVRSITTEAYYGFKSNCISSVSPLRDSNIGTDCIEGTGCYQICGSRNLYKAAHHSIMDVFGSPPYNTFNNIHIKFLCIQLKDQTGSVGGICTTKFGIT